MGNQVLTEKLFYKNIMPIIIVLLEQIHSLPYYEGECSQDTAVFIEDIRPRICIQNLARLVINKIERTILVAI